MKEVDLLPSQNIMSWGTIIALDLYKTKKRRQRQKEDFILPLLRRHCLAWGEERVPQPHFLRTRHCCARLGSSHAPLSPIQFLYRCQTVFWKCKLDSLSEYFQGFISLANYGPRPNLDTPVFVNKVLGHRHVCSSAYCQWLLLLSVSRVEWTIWTTKPKIFTEKVCWPQTYRMETPAHEHELQDPAGLVLLTFLASSLGVPPTPHLIPALLSLFPKEAFFLSFERIVVAKKKKKNQIA